MREAAAVVAERGADAIDINMGCPVPKVRKTGAGAALLGDPDRAVAVARAAVEGAGRIGVGGIPVTVKLRSGLRPGEESGYELAHRLVLEAGVAAIGFHPRSAAVHHKGVPDYELAARLVDSLPAPVILTGGMNDADAVRDAFASTGAAAVMLARGALGNPWLFSELLREPRTGARASAEADPRAGPGRAALDDRARRRAPRRASRRTLSAQVLPVVRAAPAARGERREEPAGIAADGGDARPRARAAGRGVPACGARRLSARHGRSPRYTAALADASAAGGIPARSGVLCAEAGPPTRSRFPPIHMPKDVILTPEGLQKLKDELELLSTEKRREVAERIKEAREFGDIAENSEYDDAKNEQAMVESRIAQLQEKLRMATVIQAKDLSTDVVQVGSVVHVKDEKTGKSVKYTIVGSAEAKPNEYKLSNESPVGRALLGHRRNETVAVTVPRGPARKLKITKIDVGLE